MKTVKTKDGSETLFHPVYKETFHSITGAVEEARRKFVEPCEIAKRAEKGKIAILDICFGLGYNSAVALETIQNVNPNCDVYIMGLENDQKVIDMIPSMNPSIKDYNSILDNVHLYIGDARKTIKEATIEFEVVFLDPFSPKSCPELWTKEFFLEIKKHMKPNSVLATYSCARSVRKNLSQVGFIVKNGPCVRRRGPSTLAFLKH